MLKIWKKIDSKIAFKNKYWSYLIDHFTIDGDKVFEYHYVQTLGSTMVIPIRDDGKIILIKQYRYLNQNFSLEFPCGSIEEGLTIDENAKKELSEETGFTAKRIEQIGFFNPFNGVTNEICYVFIAEDLIPIKANPDETEQFELLFLTENEIEEKIETNEIWDGMTLAAWMQYKQIKKGAV